MKIGILTHPLDYNYGCLFQAFALQKILKSMGHEVITINRYTDINRPFMVALKNWCGRLVSRIKGNKVTLAWYPGVDFKTIDALCAKTNKFKERNIVSTERVVPYQLEEIDKKFMFDAYVVGSDQVWLPHFCPTAFLDFVHRNNVKCVFYAASSGEKSFADDPNIIPICKKLCKKFSGISVREDSLLPIARELLGRQDAIQVLDPTLLLDMQDYLDSCVEEYSNDEPVIFTYVLDKTTDKQTLIDSVAKMLNIPVVSGSVEKDYVKGTNYKLEDCIYPSVDNWIHGIARAQFVITDSFHGTCMSIVFRKPFVVVGNASRGIGRFLSVLKLFDLEDRLIRSSSEFRETFYESLDDARITNLLNNLKDISLGFIKESLK